MYKLDEDKKHKKFFEKEGDEAHDEKHGHFHEEKGHKKGGHKKEGRNLITKYILNHFTLKNSFFVRTPPQVQASRTSRQERRKGSQEKVGTQKGEGRTRTLNESGFACDYEVFIDLIQ